MNRSSEFLVSRRARITPEQAGLPDYGSHRRVKGLRREEVAMLAGVNRVQRVLDAMTGAPAWVRNGRADILATNQLGRQPHRRGRACVPAAHDLTESTINETERAPSCEQP